MCHHCENDEGAVDRWIGSGGLSLGRGSGDPRLLPGPTGETLSLISRTYPRKPGPGETWCGWEVERDPAPRGECSDHAKARASSAPTPPAPEGTPSAHELISHRRMIASRRTASLFRSRLPDVHARPGVGDRMRMQSCASSPWLVGVPLRCR